MRTRTGTRTTKARMMTASDQRRPKAASAAADEPKPSRQRGLVALLRWPARRLALVLGEHPVTVGRFLADDKDLPGVTAWLDLITAPLRRQPKPQPRGKGDASDELPMDNSELRARRLVMHWTPQDVATLTDRPYSAIRRMEEGKASVDDALARWMRAVSVPILAYPQPTGWMARHAFDRSAPGQPALPRALPDNPHRWDDAKREHRNRLRQEAEERRLAAREQNASSTREERRWLAAERARRAAELDNGHRTVEEIGRELGISHQAVSYLRKRRRVEATMP